MYDTFSLDMIIKLHAADRFYSWCGQVGRCCKKWHVLNYIYAENTDQNSKTLYFLLHPQYKKSERKRNLKLIDIIILNYFFWKQRSRCFNFFVFATLWAWLPGLPLSPRKYLYELRAIKIWKKNSSILTHCIVPVRGYKVPKRPPN